MLDFSRAKVLVVGDVMLDQYWRGDTGRISPEAPVPVVKVLHNDVVAGGCANVAMNAVALGAQVGIVGLIGQDEAGDQLSALLETAGVATYWVRSEQITTIRKLRVMSRQQQLIRLDFETPPPSTFAEGLLIKVIEQLPHYDILVISDYAKGALVAVQEMIQVANRLHKPVFVDPKGTDFNRYYGATLIKPNLSEFQAIVGQVTSDDSIAQAGSDLLARLSLSALLVTRSEAGMSLLTNNQPALHLPTQALEVFDVTGAGDTAMATLAVAVASGMNLPSAVRLANAASGLVVKKLGTSVITCEELTSAVHPPTHTGAVAHQWETLEAWVRHAQSVGESVVMTNGCFDLLHPGHVRYLRAAKALGDRLVVAVNSDASVKRLKGESRPINSLEVRMEMLSALESVDWVVSFDQDTPESLICQIKPNILVKGGDYDISQIAGAKCVQSAGGEVKALDFWQGHSTTAIIDRLQQ